MAHKRLVVLSIVVRIVVCVVLLAIGGGIFRAFVVTKPEPARTSNAGTKRSVAVMAARPVAVHRQWDGYGTAAAMDSANVPARVTATVIGIEPRVLAGTAVTRGQLLVRLDDSDFARQVEIATHAIADLDAQLARLEIEVASWTERRRLAADQVALARADFQRVEQAARDGGANPRDVDVAKRSLLSAINDEVVVQEEFDKLIPRKTSLEAQRERFGAERRQALQNVERCRIRSPLDGVLEDVDVEVGESLAAGQRVARVVDPALIEVPLRLPASARASVRVGDEAWLDGTGPDARSWSATIARIAPRDDESRRTVTVYIEVAQDPAERAALAPGQFLRGRVAAAESRRRWVVPRRAVEGDRILLVEDGVIVGRNVDVDYQVEARFPELGVVDEQWVVLKHDLPDGALVVTTTSRALADGLAVHPVTVGIDVRTARDGPGPDGAAAEETP